MLNCTKTCIATIKLASHRTLKYPGNVEILVIFFNVKDLYAYVFLSSILQNVHFLWPIGS